MDSVIFSVVENDKQQTHFSYNVLIFNIHQEISDHRFNHYHPIQSTTKQFCNLPEEFFSQFSECSFKTTNGECLSDANYRTFDGSCNNLFNPWWGTSNIPFRRLLNANYADGINEIVCKLKNKNLVRILGEFLPRELSVTGIRLPSPREISNACSNEIESRIERSVNDLFTAFAQFVDHDLSSAANGLDDDLQPVTCQCEEQIKNPFCLNIPTPEMLDQSCMLFPRSSALFQREPACQLSK